MADTYKPGNWLAICDVCGFQFFADELEKRWDGYMVCRKDFETRHPQELLRSRAERSIPWSRPEQADVFIGPDYSADSYYWAQDYTTPDDPDISANRYIDAAA